MKYSVFSILIALANISMAAPLWNMDMENMPASQPPVIQAATKGSFNAYPQKYTNANSANKIEVTSNFTANGLTLSGKSLVFIKTATDDQELTLIGHTEDYVAWTDYQLSFDLLADTRNTGQPLNVRLTTSSSSTNVGDLIFHMDGSLILRSTLAEGSGLSLAGVWDPSKINTIVIQVNSETNTLSTFINGLSVGSLLLDLTDPLTNPLGVNRIRFRNNSSNQLYRYGFGIDNIVTSNTLDAIPEPSTWSLLSVAGVALVFCYRRRAANRVAALSR